MKDCWSSKGKTIGTGKGKKGKGTDKGNKGKGTGTQNTVNSWKCGKPVTTHETAQAWQSLVRLGTRSNGTNSNLNLKLQARL